MTGLSRGAAPPTVRAQCSPSEPGSSASSSARCGWRSSRGSSGRCCCGLTRPPPRRARAPRRRSTCRGRRPASSTSIRATSACRATPREATSTPGISVWPPVTGCCPVCRASCSTPPAVARPWTADMQRRLREHRLGACARRHLRPLRAPRHDHGPARAACGLRHADRDSRVLRALTGPHLHYQRRTATRAARSRPGSRTRASRRETRS